MTPELETLFYIKLEIIPSMLSFIRQTTYQNLLFETFLLERTDFIERSNKLKRLLALFSRTLR